MYTPVQHGREANIAHDRNTNDWIHDSNWNLQSESMNDEQFYHYPYQQMYCKSRMNTITTISSRKVHIHNHGHEHLHPWKTKTVTYTPILRYSDKLHVFPFCGGYYPQYLWCLDDCQWINNDEHHGFPWQAVQFPEDATSTGVHSWKKKGVWDLPEISLLNSRIFWAENPLLFHGIRPWPLSRTSHREHIWRSFSVVKSCESRSCSGKHRDLIVQLPVFHILNNSARVWNYFLYEFTEKTRFIYDFCETCRSQMTKPWFYHDVWYLLRKKKQLWTEMVFDKSWLIDDTQGV